MSTYLIPISDGASAEILKTSARSFTEAEDKFVKLLASKYECVDLGGSFNDAQQELFDSNIIVGEVYDIDEF